MALLKTHDVSLVSVTQQFDTSTSMGRLTLNILFSFAQFERELCSERIRDKFRATRRRGKWAHRRAVLGYDAVRDGRGCRLVVNEKEAGQVRTIFRKYRHLLSAYRTADWLNCQGLTTKPYVTAKGFSYPGTPHDSAKVGLILSNPLYVGLVSLRRKTIYVGEHEAIVPDHLFGEVQAMLRLGARKSFPLKAKRHFGILRGWLRCASCQNALSPHQFSQRGRYYQCCHPDHRLRCILRVEDAERLVLDAIRPLFRSYPTVSSFVQKARMALQKETSRQLAIAEEQWRRLRSCGYLKDGMSEGWGSPESAHLVFTSRAMRGPYERVVMLNHRQRCGHDLGGVGVRFNRAWPTLTFMQKRKLIRLCTESITYDHVRRQLTISRWPHQLKPVLVEASFTRLRHRRLPTGKSSASD
jgi:site-specific DNA recombinase